MQDAIIVWGILALSDLFLCKILHAYIMYFQHGAISQYVYNTVRGIHIVLCCDTAAIKMTILRMYKTVALNFMNSVLVWKKILIAGFSCWDTVFFNLP